jgi:hypothetical protein
MSIKSKPLQRFSYPAKTVTVVAKEDISGKRLSRKRQKELINRATELVGIVPIDWERAGNQFIMYFGVDTVDLASDAKRRLEQSGFEARFWTDEEGAAIFAKMLRCKRVDVRQTGRDHSGYLYAEILEPIGLKKKHKSLH